MQKCIVRMEVGKALRETHTSGQNNKTSSLWDPGSVGGRGDGGRIQGREEPEKVSHNCTYESVQIPNHTYERMKDAKALRITLWNKLLPNL